MMTTQTLKSKVPTNYIEYTTDTYKQSHMLIYGIKHINIKIIQESSIFLPNLLSYHRQTSIAHKIDFQLMEYRDGKTKGY